MKVAELIVHMLEEEGVKRIYGVPGEENLALIEAIRKSKIHFILTHHEQAAAIMAATEGRLTGKAGVCLSTLGPGVTNLMTGVAYAQLGAMPILVITGQKPIKTSKQADFQMIDVIDMMQPISKYTKQIIFGKAIPTQIQEAKRTAELERPGVAHLELPEDVAAEEVEVAVPSSICHRRPVAEEKAIHHAIELIEKAKRPLILIGAGANRKLTSKMLREFIDTFEIPFFDTQMGKGVVDNRHALYLGCAALSQNDYLHRAIEKSDLIINVGHDVVEKPPFFMKENGPQVIHINFSAANIDPVYFPQAEVVGDIANSIWQISNKLKKSSHWDFEYFKKNHQAFIQSIQKYEKMEAYPIVPPRLVREIRELMPEDGLLALDNGMYKIWFARNYLAYLPNTLLLDNALATMGAGLPSAITAALLFPERKTMAICGDGGFLMNAQELLTAVKLGVHLIVIILKDNGLGMIRWKQEEMGFEDYAMSFKNPDFVKLAESFGASGYRVESIADLREIIKTAQNKEGVHVLEVDIDYSVNNQILNRDLQEKIDIL